MLGDVPSLSRGGGWSTTDLNDTLLEKKNKKIKKLVEPKNAIKNFSKKIYIVSTWSPKIVLLLLNLYPGMYDHTSMNTSVLVRSRKLSIVGPG